MTDGPTAYFVEGPAETHGETDGFVLCRVWTDGRLL